MDIYSYIYFIFTKTVYSGNVKILTLVFLLSSFLLKGQDPGPDSLAMEKSGKFSLYVAPGYSNSQLVDIRASYIEIHVGLVYLERIDFDIYYSAVLDNFKKQIIFPSSHEYDQRNIGIRAQYSFLKKWIRPHIGIGYQFTEAIWLPESDSEQEFNDYIDRGSLYCGFGWLINNTFTLKADIGYGIASGVDLIGFDSGDYDGFEFNVMLKIKLLRI